MQTFTFAENAPHVIMLSGADVRRLLSWPDAVTAVETAFHALGTGTAPSPGVLGFHVDNGGFHIKAGLSRLHGGYFVTKINANMPGNAQLRLPTIQGVIALFDASDGRLLALIDSIEITARRTGAATGVAAKYLARTDATSLTIIGCGVQAYAQIRCVAEVRPIDQVFAFDLREDAARVLAQRIRHDLDIDAEPVPTVRAGTRTSDVVITCTTSKTPVLSIDDVRPGTFVAGVGADNPEKHELHPDLLRASKLITDLTQQSAAMGDLHHADVTVVAELAEIVAGKVQITPSSADIYVFDSTGMALQDVYAAAHVYERALADVQ